MATRKSKTPTDRSRPQPRPQPAADDLRRVVGIAEQTRRDAEACAKLAALPVRHEHAAGIDVGDSSHWVCVEATPDSSDTVRAEKGDAALFESLFIWKEPHPLSSSVLCTSHAPVCERRPRALGVGPPVESVIPGIDLTDQTAGPRLVQRLPVCLPVPMQQRPSVLDHRLHDPAIDPLGLAYPNHENAQGKHGVRQVSVALGKETLVGSLDVGQVEVADQLHAEEAQLFAVLEQLDEQVDRRVGARPGLDLHVVLLGQQELGKRFGPFLGKPPFLFGDVSPGPTK